MKIGVFSTNFLCFEKFEIDFQLYYLSRCAVQLTGKPLHYLALLLLSVVTVSNYHYLGFLIFPQIHSGTKTFSRPTVNLFTGHKSTTDILTLHKAVFMKS